MDCNLLRGRLILVTEKTKAHTGPGASAASEEGPLSSLCESGEATDQPLCDPMHSPVYSGEG